jgi:hypothetical protein
MEWTAREREQIVLAYAHDGVAFCPDDLEPLTLLPESRTEVNRRGVNLRCSICGRQSNSPTVPLGVALVWLPIQ